jgi:hypothetical protein
MENVLCFQVPESHSGRKSMHGQDAANRPKYKAAVQALLRWGNISF